CPALAGHPPEGTLQLRGVLVEVRPFVILEVRIVEVIVRVWEIGDLFVRAFVHDRLQIVRVFVYWSAHSTPRRHKVTRDFDATRAPPLSDCSAEAAVRNDDGIWPVAGIPSVLIPADGPHHHESRPDSSTLPTAELLCRVDAPRHPGVLSVSCVRNRVVLTRIRTLYAMSIRLERRFSSPGRVAIFGGWRDDLFMPTRMRPGGNGLCQLALLGGNAARAEPRMISWLA